MNSNSRATAVGVFVLIGLLCLAYMTIKLGKMEFFSNEGFELQAVFTNVSGLRVGADIEMAGIPVGHVSKISLRRTDTDTTAIVTLRFNQDLKLPDDTIASVKTGRPHRRQVHRRRPGRIPRYLEGRRRNHGYRALYRSRFPYQQIRIWGG